jgi:hypothetical protein
VLWLKVLVFFLVVLLYHMRCSIKCLCDCQKFYRCAFDYPKSRSCFACTVLSSVVIPVSNLILRLNSFPIDM